MRGGGPVISASSPYFGSGHGAIEESGRLGWLAILLDRPLHPRLGGRAYIVLDIWNWQLNLKF